MAGCGGNPCSPSHTGSEFRRNSGDFPAPPCCMLPHTPAAGPRGRVGHLSVRARSLPRAPRRQRVGALSSRCSRATPSRALRPYLTKNVSPISLPHCPAARPRRARPLAARQKMEISKPLLQILHTYALTLPHIRPESRTCTLATLLRVGVLPGLGAPNETARVRCCARSPSACKHRVDTSSFCRANL